MVRIGYNVIHTQATKSVAKVTLSGRWCGTKSAGGASSRANSAVVRARRRPAEHRAAPGNIFLF